MWTPDEIILTVTLSGRFLAVALLVAVIAIAILRQRRRTRLALMSEAGPGGGLNLFAGGAGGGSERGAAAESHGHGTNPARRAHRAAAYRRGVLTFVGLAVLTAIEFAISLWLGSLVLLFITGLIKAALIVQFFMHASRLWQDVVEEVAS